MNIQELTPMRYLIRPIGSLMLGMVVNSAYAETPSTTHGEQPSANERTFIQQAVIDRIKKSAEYQDQKEDCDDLEQHGEDNLDCAAFRRAFNNLNFLFQVGALSETHNNDIAAITSFCRNRLLSVAFVCLFKTSRWLTHTPRQHCVT